MEWQFIEIQAQRAFKAQILDRTADLSG